MSRILVTGGAGFVGSHLVDVLVRQSHKVAIIDDFSPGRDENVNPNAQLFVCDISDPNEVEGVFRIFRPEQVYHLAANPSVLESLIDPHSTVLANVAGTVNILEAMRKQGCKELIFASTSGAVYGQPKKLPVKESEPLKPLDQYGTSKVACETFIEMYIRTYGFEAKIVRLPNMYGPRQNPSGGCGVIAKFSEAMLQYKPITINGDGRKVRDFLYISDAIEGLLVAGDFSGSCTVNLGTGVGTRIIDIFDGIAEATNYDSEPNFGPDKKGEVQEIYSDPSLAEALLGWTARTSLREGLKKTVQWYREVYGIEVETESEFQPVGG